MSASLKAVAAYTGVSLKVLRKFAKRVGEDTVLRNFGPPEKPKRKKR